MRVLRAFLFLSVFLLAAPAWAQSVCSQLQSQLAAIDNGGGGQYQRAQAAYNAAYSQARAMGCLTLFRIFAPPQCGAVLQNLDMLQANLRATPALPGGNRAAIVAALQANGCTGRTNGDTFTRRTGGDTFRTVCVRPEDGYYFPISFATTSNQFAADEAACQQQCVEARLFVHRNPGETMDNAVDLNGQRYVDTPTAFRFRETFDPTIKCTPSPEVLAARAAAAVPQPAPAPGPVIPVPWPRPERSEDPETLANRAGGLVLPTVQHDGEDDVLMANGVRLIGPAFFYYAQ
jgi:hypothetical protein